MSAIKCEKCGELRKVDQVSDGYGYIQPPCRNCDDQGWYQPFITEEEMKAEDEN